MTYVVVVRWEALGPKFYGPFAQYDNAMDWIKTNQPLTRPRIIEVHPTDAVSPAVRNLNT